MKKSGGGMKTRRRWLDRGLGRGQGRAYRHTATARQETAGRQGDVTAAVVAGAKALRSGVWHPNRLVLLVLCMHVLQPGSVMLLVCCAVCVLPPAFD